MKVGRPSSSQNRTPDLASCSRLGAEPICTGEALVTRIVLVWLND